MEFFDFNFTNNNTNTNFINTNTNFINNNTNNNSCINNTINAFWVGRIYR